MFRLLCLLSIALALTAGAAPITVKEIDFLLRQQTPEAEITSQVQERRLLAAMDPAGEALLRGHGATPGLLAILKQEQLVLSPAEAQAFLARSAAPKFTPDAPLRSSIPAASAPAAAPVASAPASVGAPRTGLAGRISGKLMRLEGNQLKPFDSQQLKDVRLFVIYNSAAWCGPCRRFTPKLVEFYNRMKPKHPQFEVLFLSSDRDEGSMAAYMQADHMPWPAMRFGSQGEIQQSYCGNGIPWLVCVSADGKPLTKNGQDKQYIPPEEILGAVEYLLAEMK